MVTIGSILLIVGLIGSIWAKLYMPSISDYANYAFTGGSAFKIHAYRFFNGYGMVIIIVGIALIIWGIYRKNKNSSSVHVGSLSHDRHANDTDAENVNQTMSDNVKLVLDPETREIMWICGNCGHANSCDDMTCANCQSKR